jgi:hypothetical protein
MKYKAPVHALLFLLCRGLYDNPLEDRDEDNLPRKKRVKMKMWR